MKQVTFQKHWRQYNPGEVAVFDDETAADLIKRGGATDNGHYKHSTAPSIGERMAGMGEPGPLEPGLDPTNDA